MESAEGEVLRRITFNDSMRLPRSTRNAGSTTIALSAESMTTALAAMPTERRKYIGKTNSPVMASVTVIALNRMVRPALVTVAMIAA